MDAVEDLRVLADALPRNAHNSYRTCLDKSQPLCLTETENEIIDDILALLKMHGFTSHQSLRPIEQLGRIIEMGQRVAKGTTHCLSHSATHRGLLLRSNGED